MDYIRSAYEVDMQFDAAGDIVRRVRWFFTAPGAKRFPLVNPFFSGNWGDLRGGPAGPGEVWSSDRPWSNGARPAPLLGKGDFCGDPDWWLDGTPSDAPDLPLVDGVPMCCGTAGIKGQVGVKVGLSHTTPCLYQTDFTGATLTSWLTTDKPTDQVVPGAALWYIPDFLHSVAYFEAFVNSSVPWCLSSQVRSQSVGVIDQDPVPFVGFYQGNPYWLVFQASPGWVPVPNALFIVKLRVPPYRGKVGVKVRPDSTYSPHVYSGQVGIEVDASGQVMARYVGNAGIQVGVSGELVGALGGAVGIMVSPTGEHRGRVTGQVGVKVDTAAAVRHVGHGQVGVKVSPTAGPRRKIAATVGVKVSPSGTLYTGVVTACCPGVVIPTTLTGTDGGAGSITATYNAGSGQWQYTDPSSGFLIILKCTNPGTGFVWQLSPNVTAHCSVSHTLNSLTCHPFHIDVQCTATGALCIEAGTYRAILS